jgi:hypothetical protein
VTLRSRAIYAVGLRGLQAHVTRDALAQQLADYQQSDRFAHVEEPAATGLPPRRVASFVFDRERLSAPDPHLPETFRARVGERLKGTYLICVGTDGRVQKVSAVQGVPGADQAIMEHLRTTWVYKPQPVPVCSSRTFVFEIN